MLLKGVTESRSPGVCVSVCARALVGEGEEEWGKVWLFKKYIFPSPTTQRL